MAEGMTISRWPIKDRIARSSQTQIRFSSLIPGGRPMQYKEYNEEKLYAAYEEVLFKNVAVRQAAMMYGVPVSTLRDRVSGRVPFGKKSGPTRYLTNEEENELVCFVTGAAEMGYSYTRADVLELVQEILVRKNIATTISHGWWEGFKKRHPEITLRKPEPVSHVRANCAQPEVLRRYFDELEVILKGNELMESPSCIFNMDESGFPLDPKSLHIVCKRGQRHPSTLCSGNKSQITVLACCNAAGYVIPPFVIFDRKILKAELTVGEVPETMYGLSNSGWIDSELFDAWFQNHFLSYAPASRPLVLILDGHSSHFNPATLRRAAEEDIIMFCLPPHTSHKTQPLDKGCFGPLKVIWREECHTYLKKNSGKVITRFQFSEIFGKAWKRGMTTRNIVAGFETTGFYPFNPDKLIPKIPKKAPSFYKKTSIKYMPFFSPISQQKRRQLISNQLTHTSQATSPVESPTNSVNDESMDSSSTPPSLRFDPATKSTNWASLRSQPPLLQLDMADSDMPSPISFTCEEMVKFQRRKDENFDLPGDERYQLWLRQYSRHSTPYIDNSTVSDESYSASVLNHTSAMASLLSQKSQQVKLPKPNVSTSSRVLTSIENLKRIKEKEEKKAEELKAKEERKLEREAKRKEKLGILKLFNI